MEHKEGRGEITLERWLVYHSSYRSQTGKLSLDFPGPLAKQEVVLMCGEKRWELREALIERHAFPSLPPHRAAVGDSDFLEMLLSCPAQCSLSAEGEIAAGLCPFTGCWRFPGSVAPSPPKSWRIVGALGLLPCTQGCASSSTSL